MAFLLCSSRRDAVASRIVRGEVRGDLGTELRALNTGEFGAEVLLSISLLKDNMSFRDRSLSALERDAEDSDLSLLRSSLNSLNCSATLAGK